MTYRSIAWKDSDARLKTFSASVRASATTVVKIEVEVRDPIRLGMLLQDLHEISREQTATMRRAASAVSPKRPAPRGSARQLASQQPLLLTHRKD